MLPTATVTFLIRAALGWAIENGRGDEASELSSLSLELLALALYNASFARVVGMDTERMAVRLDESPSLPRELGDRAGVAKVKWGMGTLRMYSDDFESALDDFGIALAEYEILKVPFMKGWTHRNWGPSS